MIDNHHVAVNAIKKHVDNITNSIELRKSLMKSLLSNNINETLLINHNNIVNKGNEQHRFDLVIKQVMLPTQDDSLE